MVTDTLLSASRSPQSEPKQRMDGNFSPLAILSVVLLSVVFPSPTASLEPFDLLYDSGVRAFYNSDYVNVVRFMEGAISSYGEARSSKVRCRLMCQDQHPFDGSFSDLRFFDAVLRRAACMNGCIEEKLGAQSVHKVSEDVLQDFHRRIPYNYLQLAYLKVRGGSTCGSLNGRYCCPLSGESVVSLLLFLPAELCVSCCPATRCRMCSDERFSGSTRVNTS